MTEHPKFVIMKYLITIETDTWPLEEHLPPGFEGYNFGAVPSPHSYTGWMPNLRVPGERKQVKEKCEIWVSLSMTLSVVLQQCEIPICLIPNQQFWKAKPEKSKLFAKKLSNIWCVMTEGLTLHKCKTRDKPKRAAPGLACPDHLTQPNEICTSGFPVARLQ